MLAGNTGRANANAKVGSVADEPRAYFHNFYNGNRQTHALGNARSQQLIGQYSNMLWVILKLHDVVMAIVGKHQMALGASAHRAQMLFDVDHRRGMISRNREVYSAPASSGV